MRSIVDELGCFRCGGVAQDTTDKGKRFIYCAGCRAALRAEREDVSRSCYAAEVEAMEWPEIIFA